MKVLEVTANWGRGGPGGVVKDLYALLVESGCECTVAFGRGSIPEAVSNYRIGSELGVYAHALLARLTDSASLHSKNATQGLIRYIESRRPDVIHVHNLLGYYIEITTFFSYLKHAGIPVVWTLHDCWPFTGHCINFERIGCEKWKNGCYDCQLMRDHPPSWFIDRSRRNYLLKKDTFCGVPGMTLVTPSVWLKRKVSDSFLQDYPIMHIPNGIDIDQFRPVKSDLRRKHGLDGKKVLLAVAGVWNEMKGLGLINAIAEELSNKYCVVLIGETGKQFVSEKILKFDRTENVQELIEWYGAADMLINPTFGDNFPTVNIEALCCGLPVVTNATGGSPETAENEAGRVVYSKRKDEFIQRIEECAAEEYSKDYVRSFGIKYDRCKCAESYLQLFERIKN